MPTIRAAVVQAEITPDLDAALHRTAALARAAADQGAKLVVFPETWIPGYPAWLDVCRDAGLWDHPPVKRVYARMAANSVVVDGNSGRRLAEIAHDTGVVLALGVVERVETGRNRGTLF